MRLDCSCNMGVRCDCVAVSKSLHGSGVRWDELLVEFCFKPQGGQDQCWSAGHALHSLHKWHGRQNRRHKTSTFLFYEKKCMYLKLQWAKEVEQNYSWKVKVFKQTKLLAWPLEMVLQALSKSLVSIKWHFRRWKCPHMTWNKCPK